MAGTRHVDVRSICVKPDTAPLLTERDTRDRLGIDRANEEAILADLRSRLTTQQSLLAGDRTRSLLAVFQGMDASGKDGSIRAVMWNLNPMKFHQVGFGVPSKEDLAHDFLWRVHRETPGVGEIGLFNRSHYEDVVVVRVEDLVPRSVWKKRYGLIRDFENILTQNGTAVVKFMLNISLDDQLERLRERAHVPLKRWKYNPSDYANRAKWDAYMAAYEDALKRTSTKNAPWYVVPAGRKWVRNIVVLQTIVDTLEAMSLVPPKFPADVPPELAEPPAKA